MSDTVQNPEVASGAIVIALNNLLRAERLVRELQAAVDVARTDGTTPMTLGELLAALRDAQGLRCKAADQYQAAGGKLGEAK